MPTKKQKQNDRIPEITLIKSEKPTGVEKPTDITRILTDVNDYPVRKNAKSTQT